MIALHLNVGDTERMLEVRPWKCSFVSARAARIHHAGWALAAKLAAAQPAALPLPSPPRAPRSPRSLTNLVVHNLVEEIINPSAHL